MLAISHYKMLTEDPYSIVDKVSDKANDVALQPKERKFYKLIGKCLAEIIIGRPDRLEQLIRLIQPVYNEYIDEGTVGLAGRDKATKTKSLKNEVFSVFDYTGFIQNPEGAYKLAEKLQCDVCLYCNRQYTFTLNTNEGKTRPQFDHFLDKGTYPYLALSFYNLVPSCYICNSNLKGTKKFSVTKHLHPLIEGADEYLSFKTHIDKSDFVEGKIKSFKLSYGRKNLLVNSKDFERADRNFKVFHLESLYNMHIDYVAELIKKTYVYNEARINELLNFTTASGTRLFSSRKEVVELIIGNYLDNAYIGKRILSKMTRDIAIELGLLTNEVYSELNIT